MAFIYRVKCDGCSREVAPPRAVNWYKVVRRSIVNPEFEECDGYDFCSLPCVTSWAARREIDKSPRIGLAS